MKNNRLIFSDEARRASFIRKTKITIVAGGVIGVLMGGFIAHHLSHVFSKENTQISKLDNPLLSQDKE